MAEREVAFWACIRFEVCDVITRGLVELGRDLLVRIHNGHPGQRWSKKNEQYDWCVGMVASGIRVCSNSRRR